MWRLMYAMIVVSDNGSVAVSANHSDWGSQHTCEQMIQKLFSTPPTSSIGGHTLTIKTNAQCVPVDIDAAEMPQPGGFPAVTFGPRGLRIGPRY
jgi:hypothetical protein